MGDKTLTRPGSTNRGQASLGITLTPDAFIGDVIEVHAATADRRPNDADPESTERLDYDRAVAIELAARWAMPSDG